jgi:hypothetical protein
MGANTKGFKNSFSIGKKINQIAHSAQKKHTYAD